MKFVKQNCFLFAMRISTYTQEMTFLRSFQYLGFEKVEINLKLRPSVWNVTTALISRKAQYKDVYRSRRTIEILQCTRSLWASCCVKVHNAHVKLASPI